MTEIINGEPAEGIATRLYQELRHVAAAYLRNESPGHTLQPTALVHEVWLHLGDLAGQLADDEARFRAVAAGAMRQILFDHARRKNAKKRGGSWLQTVEADWYFARAWLHQKLGTPE